MNKKQYLIQKIRNLIISIEVLNIYSKKYLNEFVTRSTYKNLKNPFFLIASKFILGSNLKINFIYIILYIYHIYMVVNNENLQRIANKIIKEYTTNSKSELLKQYVNKFYYIYNKINHYYDYFNHNNKYIYDISIINLYIINQTNKRKGLFFLIKYLLSNKIY